MIKSKKKLIGSAVFIICLIICVSISTISAYLSANDRLNNVFTAGSVAARIEEIHSPTEDSNTNGIADAWENVAANQIITKDPAVANIGKNDAYVFVSVDIPHEVVKVGNGKGELENNGVAYNTPVYEYEVNANWQEVAGNDTAKVYAYAKDGDCIVLNPAKSTNTVFDKIKTINVIQGEIAKGTEENIVVKAYAIQTNALGEDDTVDASAIWRIITNQLQITEFKNS